MITLTEKARERDTYPITVTVLDNGVAAVPNSGVTWTLTDALGNVVNSRSAVAITAASVMTVVLSGLDLAVDETNETLYGRGRRLIVEGTYDSLTYGSNLPFKLEVAFEIEDAVKPTGVI